MYFCHFLRDEITLKHFNFISPFIALSTNVSPLSSFKLLYFSLYFVPQKTFLLLFYTISIHFDVATFLLLFIPFYFFMLPSGIIFLLSEEVPLVFPFFFFLMFIYFWGRERQSMSRGGAEREGDTECEAGSRLWAVSTEPDAGLELTSCEIMTWAEVGCSTDWAAQALLVFPFLISSFFVVEIWLGCCPELLVLAGPCTPVFVLHSSWPLSCSAFWPLLVSWQMLQGGNLLLIGLTSPCFLSL